MTHSKPTHLLITNRRTVLGGLGAIALVSGACQHTQSKPFDAIVGADGYPSVSSAIASAPDTPTRPFRILVREGFWHEKLRIEKPHIHLIGESRDRSVLNFDAAEGTLGSDGKRYGLRCGSVEIYSTDCVLENLTVRNSFDYNGAREHPNDNPEGEWIQALALTIGGKADRTRVENVNLESWQDTLFVNKGRSYFRNCRIDGVMDYIFGAGTAYFESCEIHSLKRPGYTLPREGHITAPSTDITNPYGLIFSDCRLTKTADMPVGAMTLGRPWHNTKTAIGQSVFLNCWMDDHIDPEGWDRMKYGRNEDGSLKWFLPEDARFFEYRSHGPGSNGTPQRRQLTTAEAGLYSRNQVLGNWSI